MMDKNTTKNVRFSPRLTMFDRRTLEEIHDRSCRILETTGVRMPHGQVADRLAEAGAKVDRDGQRVHLPRRLVDESLAGTARTYELFSQDGQPAARFGVGSRNYNSIAGEAHWLENGIRRPARLDDVVAGVHMADRLEWINIAGSMADPQDIPAKVRCVHVAATMLKYSRKPITFWYYDGPSAGYVNELLIAAAGGEDAARNQPRTYAFLEPISPLSFPRDGLDVIYQTRRLNLPVSIGPMAQAGVSAPVTLAGTVVQENAEVLAAICAVQAIQPGAAICYGGIPHAFDMATTQMIFAGPEQALMAIAMTELARFYGLPVYVNVGLTDSKVPDAQAGMEIAATLMAGMLAGADIFGHLGICGVDQASSLDMLILQNEIIGYLEHVVGGIEVSEDAFAVELIERVGPGGSFLAEDHTAERFRTQLHFPRLLDRHFFDNWRRQGGSSMAERIAEEKTELLRRPCEPVVDAATAAELDRIVLSAQKHLLK